MQTKLQFPPNLSSDLAQFYSVSHVYPELRGCLLSIKGICIERGEFNFCNSCMAALRNKHTKNPPKFAIANGNFIGDLPENLKDIKSTEVALVSLAGHITQVVKVQGGIGKKLVGHSTVFLNKPGLNKRISCMHSTKTDE
jgi:cobalamin biosynthesis protein CbiD